jgi:hypothetical protein
MYLTDSNFQTAEINVTCSDITIIKMLLMQHAADHET